MRHPLTKLFHLSSLLQMPNDCRMVDTEVFSNFSCSFKRISFVDCSQFVIVNFWWSATMLLIFESLVFFAKLLELPLHCTVISSSWATFHVVVNWSLSTSKGWLLCSLSSRLSSPLQNFLNCHCTMHLLAVPGLYALLMLKVISTALWHIWTWIKKNCLTLFFV